MKTVTLSVHTPREVSAELVCVWKSRKADSNARISFATPELLWKVLLDAILMAKVAKSKGAPGRGD